MSTCDLDDVVMKDSEVEFAEGTEDVKPVLGNSVSTAFVLPNLDGTFTPMKHFDGNGLALVQSYNTLGVLTETSFNPSEVLVAASLNKFVELISTWEQGSGIGLQH